MALLMALAIVVTWKFPDIQLQFLAGP